MNMLTKVGTFATKLITGALYTKIDGSKAYVPKDANNFLDFSNIFLLKAEANTTISSVVNKLDTNDQFDDATVSAKIDTLNKAIDASQVK